MSGETDTKCECGNACNTKFCGACGAVMEHTPLFELLGFVNRRARTAVKNHQRKIADLDVTKKRHEDNPDGSSKYRVEEATERLAKVVLESNKWHSWALALREVV